MAKPAALLKAGKGKRFLWMNPFAGEQKNKELWYLFTTSYARISITEEETKVRGFGPQA
ncbi:MAG: hypothetical protein ACLFM3_07285 [Desulfohalobiaceae bacterium]